MPLGGTAIPKAVLRRAGFGVEFGFGFSGDSASIVFLIDDPGFQPNEPHAAALDPDADGDGSFEVCDVCPGLFDPVQVDADGDGAGDACDCGPSDAGCFTAPHEIGGVRMSAGGVLEWQSEAAYSGAGTRYDVLRGDTVELPVGAGASEVCLDSDRASTSITDVDDPPSGAAAYYLVRGENSCAVGTYGNDSAANERLSAICP